MHVSFVLFYFGVCSKSIIVCSTDSRFEEADGILHNAIRKAQETGNVEAESYAMDILANLYFELDKPDEAEQLFVHLMKVVLQRGRPQNDPAVIEISVKLADIYASRGDT